MAAIAVFKRALEVIVSQWVLVGMGIVILIASQVQIPQSQTVQAEQIVSYLGVSIIFFITGCTLPTDALIESYRQWRLHLFVQTQSFLMTSALGFGVVSACAISRTFMDAGLLIGLIFASCVPTSVSSTVVLTRNAYGNDALTVAESTIGNFLGPFLTPLLLRMYCSTGAWYTGFLPEENGGYTMLYARVFKQIGASVFLPMIIGQALRYFFPDVSKKILSDWGLDKLSSCCLLVIIWQAYDQAFSTGTFASIKTNNIIFVAFIFLANFLVWLTISIALSLPWLPKRDVIAVAYCVPSKTPALGVPLANIVFAGLSPGQKSRIQLPLVMGQGIQIAMGSLLGVLFRRWICQDGNDDKQSEEPAQEETSLTSDKT